VTPPTNIEVDFDAIAELTTRIPAKERVGEFYNSLYDAVLKKHPTAFMREYSWPADGCGQPCATTPYDISELMSLGGDVFERAVPDEEKNPKPPELTAEEKDQDKELLKPLKPKEKKDKIKELKEDRQKIANVKALVARHKYILSRLHYRYDAKTLAQDPKLVGKSEPMAGGTALPKGVEREASTEVTHDKNRFQTRFNNFYRWKPVIHCPSPERGKWGKAGLDYKGLRKVWIAEDLTRKSRTQIPAVRMIKKDIPELELGPKFVVVDAGADAADGGDEAGKKGGCGCRIGDDRSSRSSAWLALAGAVALFARRRRRG
jgi:MYXO-CTERM domain-containing protein